MPAPDQPPPSAAHRLTFGPSLRIQHDLEFKAIYNERCKGGRGPMVAFVRRNTLPNPRLGLSIGRRVGNAVVRGRFKRLVREAFRHLQHDLPRWEGGSFDVVVRLHPHEPLSLAEYQELLLDVVTMLASRRPRATPMKPEPPPPSIGPTPQNRGGPA